MGNPQAFALILWMVRRAGAALAHKIFKIACLDNVFDLTRHLVFHDHSLVVDMTKFFLVSPIGGPLLICSSLLSKIFMSLSLMFVRITKIGTTVVM